VNNRILTLPSTQILQALFKCPQSLLALLTDRFIFGLGLVTGIYCLVIITTNQRMAIEFLCKTLLEKANSHAARPQCNTEECITEEETLNVASVKILQGQRKQRMCIPA